MQYVSTYNQSTPAWKLWLRLLTAKRLFFVCAALLLVLFGIYVYFINATIRNVVAFNRLQQSNSAMAVEVNNLQTEYSSLKSAVSLASAYQSGYQDVATPQFISAAPSSRAGVALSYKYP